MLGDIVSNNPRQSGSANGPAPAPQRPVMPRPVQPARPPQPQSQPIHRPVSEGYGASAFSSANHAAPQPQPVAPANVQPTQTTSAPVYAPQPSQPQPTQTQPVPALPPLLPAGHKKGGKLPLIITISGILVFVVGIAGLFLYALSGR